MISSLWPLSLLPEDTNLLLYIFETLNSKPLQTIRLLQGKITNLLNGILSGKQCRHHIKVVSKT